MTLLPDRPQLLGGLVRRVDVATLQSVDGRVHHEGQPFDGIGFELGAGPVTRWRWYEAGQEAGPVPPRYLGDPTLTWFHDDVLDDTDTPLDHYELDGRPCTGYVMAGTDGVVDQISRCVDGYPVDVIDLGPDGSVCGHRINANGGRTGDWDSALSWYQDGRLHVARTSLLSRMGDDLEHCAFGLELDEAGHLVSLADIGPYFDVTDRAAGWGDAWIVPSPQHLAPLTASPQLRLAHQLDRWWLSLLRALASGGGLDGVELLSTDARSFSTEELSWLLSEPLPALRRITISAGPYRDHVNGYFGDLMATMAAYKRSRPGLEMKVGPVWLTSPGEAPPPAANDDVIGHFDEDYRRLLAVERPAGLAGGASANASDHLLDWLVAQPSLRQVDLRHLPVLDEWRERRRRCFKEISARRPDVSLLLDPGDSSGGPPP